MSLLGLHDSRTVPSATASAEPKAAKKPKKEKKAKAAKRTKDEARVLADGGASKPAKAARSPKPPKAERRADEPSKKKAKHDEVAAEETPSDPLDAARARAASEPAEPYWPFRAAEVEIERGAGGAAERDLRASLAQSPTYAPALSLLSRLLFADGRHEEAVQLLEAARQRSDAYPDGVPVQLLAGLALHYDALDRPDLAEAALAALPKSSPREARSAIVYVRLRGEHPDDAKAIAEDALDDDPKSAVAQNNWGITRLRSGDPKDARRGFLRAIELNPALPGPYYNLAILEKYYTLDDAAAKRWFEQYWERSHADPDHLAEAFGAISPKPLAEGGDQP